MNTQLVIAIVAAVTTIWLMLKYWPRKKQNDDGTENATFVDLNQPSKSNSLKTMLLAFLEPFNTPFKWVKRRLTKRRQRNMQQPSTAGAAQTATPPPNTAPPTPPYQHRDRQRPSSNEQSIKRYIVMALLCLIVLSALYSFFRGNNGQSIQPTVTSQGTGGGSTDTASPNATSSASPKNNEVKQPSTTDSMSILRQEVAALKAREAARQADSVRLAEAVENTYQEFKESVSKELANSATSGATSPVQIRSRAYQFRDLSTPVTFDTAYQIARWAEEKTGVRAAFLLAILTQESDLGRNIGSCHWKDVMNPNRDKEPFQRICRELGRDPEATLVSCKMHDKNGNRSGWGGAMGPAQFLPSTWVDYGSLVTTYTGKAPADPWDLRDAFVAAALKLREDGANGTRQGEWDAAMTYFSGSTNLKYRLYGDNVANLANAYQSAIGQPEQTMLTSNQQQQVAPQVTKLPYPDLSGLWVEANPGNYYQSQATFEVSPRGDLTVHIHWNNGHRSVDETCFGTVTQSGVLRFTGTELANLDPPGYNRDYILGNYYASLSSDHKVLAGGWANGDKGKFTLQKQ